MAEPFMGEVRLFSFDFPPRNWAYCDGATVAIAQNQALFSLLGTQYGGDGTRYFQLPDLRGRVPMYDSKTLGQQAGEATHALTTNEVLPHTHTLQGVTTAATDFVPTGKMLAGAAIYNTSPASLVQIAPQTVGFTGGGAHQNCQPYLAVNFCIALNGIFPSRN